MNTFNLSEIFTHITQLMNVHEDMFASLGYTLCWQLAGIMLVWFGATTAIKRQGFPVSEYIGLMFTIATAFAMLLFYTRPLHVFGDRSFPHLIVDQGSYLANMLNERLLDKVSGRINGLFHGLESPGISMLFNVGDLLRWAFTSLILAIASGAVFYVIGFGYIAVAIGILMGPVFIPFYIVPDLNWIFWGWLRAMLQYSFYPVIANAYIYVMGNLLIGYIDRTGVELSFADQAKTWLPMFGLLFAFTYGILKIPSLVNSFFAGKSGESATNSGFLR